MIISETETTEIKLLPCPFCGCTEVYYFNGWLKGDRNIDNSEYRDPHICCEKCSCGFSQGSFGRGISDEKAYELTTKAWNSRV